MNLIKRSGLLLLIAFACSCSQDDFSEPLIEPTIIEGEVEIFQIFKFQVPDLPDSITSFEGTFGEQKIHVGRYSEDYLVFIIPFISEGSHLLRLSIDGVDKQWSIDVNHPYLNIEYEGYFNNYFNKVEELLLKLRDQENGDVWADNFENWVNKYQENFKSLSDNEMKTVLGALHQSIFRQIFQIGTRSIDNLDSQENILPHIGSQTHHQRFYRLNQLEIILSFPDQSLYQTLAL